MANFLIFKNTWRRRCCKSLLQVIVSEYQWDVYCIYQCHNWRTRQVKLANCMFVPRAAADTATESHFSSNVK